MIVVNGGRIRMVNMQYLFHELLPDRVRMANIDFLFFLINFKIVRGVLKLFRHERADYVLDEVPPKNTFPKTRGVDEMTVYRIGNNMGQNGFRQARRSI
jgi:hypothetical protein